MNRETILALNRLNQLFYSQAAPSFDATRQTAWTGWLKLIPILTPLFELNQSLRILDVGCGNGRFLEFLEKAFPTKSFEYFGLDLSQELLTKAKAKFTTPKNEIKSQWQKFDLVQTWLDNPDLSQLSIPIWRQTYDLIVVFGVLHHLPSCQLRLDWLKKLGSQVANGGFLITTDWQFQNEAARFQTKTIMPELVGLTTDKLEENDLILDWKQGKTHYRYCHLANPAELLTQTQALAQTLPQLQLRTSFQADGRSDTLNHYRVWQIVAASNFESLGL